MTIYVVEIQINWGTPKRVAWQPTGPNWWFTKREAEQARRAFRDLHTDQKYRIGRYRTT